MTGHTLSTVINNPPALILLKYNFDKLDVGNIGMTGVLRRHMFDTAYIRKCGPLPLMHDVINRKMFDYIAY